MFQTTSECKQILLETLLDQPFYQDLGMQILPNARWITAFFFALRRVELGFATATYTATVHGPMAQQVAGDDTTGIIRGCGCMWVGQQVTIRTTSALKILGCESRAACGIKLRCFTEPEIVGNFESA